MRRKEIMILIGVVFWNKIVQLKEGEIIMEMGNENQNTGYGYREK